MKKAILIITDGIGFSEKTEFNAFHNAKKPTYDYLFQNVPYGLISTYGLSVGLPDGQMGNSEVGHMSIGSGQVLYQDLVKISKSIDDKTLEKNLVIQKMLKSQNIHLVGLLSDGGVHSHIQHLFGLIEIILKNGKNPIIHIITDGRDVSPTSSAKYVSELLEKFGSKIQIASISGRFFTMDRDKRWERVEKGYRAISESFPKTKLSPLEYIQESYKKGENDEFIEPVAFENYNGFENGDSLIFYNFRSDRAREIITTFGDKDFSEFQRDFKEIHISTMTKYQESFPYPIIFEKDIPKNGLSETISKAGLSQLHISETEKYAHITFFFNGGIEEPFENETRILVDSPKVKTYDLQPSMSAEKITNHILESMDKDFSFIVVNYANGDMVGHTGNFDAGIQAVETVDTQIGKLLKKAKETGFSVVLTSDHGNCEEMKNEQGETLTNHTVGDVWCFVIDDEVQKVKNGSLKNIAPTILELLNIKVPKEMSKSLNLIKG